MQGGRSGRRDHESAAIVLGHVAGVGRAITGERVRCGVDRRESRDREDGRDLVRELIGLLGGERAGASGELGDRLRTVDHVVADGELGAAVARRDPATAFAPPTIAADITGLPPTELCLDRRSLIH